ncbi:MAG TPA: glycosyltransferase family 39 protein [Pseudorhodoplanes sp.]|jgi:4-amino-4-deoxy-L-arabinose transferase-like glycosyltransferase|nr:glycosyltransferase family 39 protein [Pseudorhodoplanes sp.]
MNEAVQKGRSFWPRGLTTAIDWAVASHARAAALLGLVCCLSFLPGFFQIPPVDRDEARFAQATKQMVETGDYVDIRFQDEVRYKKPVGIYWLQAAVVKAAEAAGFAKAPRTIWLYRIPSLIGASGAVLLTYWTALAFATRRAALLAGFLMAVSILLGVEARLAKTDAMLLLTVVAAMGAMARVYLGLGGDPQASRRRWILPAIFWSALAGGILIKGPLILMFVALAAAALSIHDRSARWLLGLRPLAGVIGLLVLVLPWFVAILWKSGGAFLVDSVGEDMLSKVAGGRESHGAPPGYYVVLFFVTFWPGSLLLGLAAPSIWRDKLEKGTRFLLAWAIPSWIVFEIVITKLPHYVLPLYPAIAILIASRLDPPRLSRHIWLERGALWWFVAPLVVGLGGIFLLIVREGSAGALAWPFAAAAIIFGLRAWWLYGADGPERAALRAGVASILVAFAIYGAIFPSLTSVFPSKMIADTLQASDCRDAVAAAAGYHEPSLVFLLGTDTRLTDAPRAAEFLQGGPCRFALIERSQERSFAQRAEAIGLRYTPLPRVQGVNISGGREVLIGVFRSEGQP